MTAALLQISDPHFGTEQADVVAALQRLVQAEQPRLVVLSGDITQRAQADQFAAASRFAASLGRPVLAIAGNHDIPLLNLPARLLWPYAGFQKAFGAALEPVFTTPDLLVMGVKTTRRRRHIHGEVSQAQIERVAERLAGATAAQLRVVVVHQPVAVSRPEDEPNLLRGHAAAVQRWAAAGADIVMGGHIHLPYVLALDTGTRPLWAVQAGTALSTRVRDGVPNSVNLLRWPAAGPAGEHGLQSPQCQVERWDHDAGAAAFVCQGVSVLTVARP